MRDERGQVLKWFGTCTDIDDQRRITQALGASETRLLMALEAGRMGTWEWDFATGSVEWSGNLEEMHGLLPGQFDRTFEGFRKLVHPDDGEIVKQAVARSLEEKSAFQAEFRSIRPDGSIFWMLGKGRVVTDEAGQPIRLIGVGMDVTDRRRLEEELHKRVEELAEADRRKDEFLATLAHELRNPLAPIRNALHLMAAPAAPAAATSRPSRAMAERQVVHLARLIDDLMDVSRISRGKIELRKQAVDLAAVVRRAVEIGPPWIDERGHALTVSLPGRPDPRWRPTRRGWSRSSGTC